MEIDHLDSWHMGTGATDNGAGSMVTLEAIRMYDTKTHHTSIDTYEALVFDDLKQAAIVMASTVYHLAMRDEMFPRKQKTK